MLHWISITIAKCFQCFHQLRGWIDQICVVFPLWISWDLDLDHIKWMWTVFSFLTEWLSSLNEPSEWVGSLNEQHLILCVTVQFCAFVPYGWTPTTQNPLRKLKRHREPPEHVQLVCSLITMHTGGVIDIHRSQHTVHCAPPLPHLCTKWFKNIHSLQI